MIELSVLLLALLSSTRWHQQTETQKELYNRLGLHPYKYKQMPFAGGRTVMTFPNGTMIVELVTQEDFSIAGTSMDDQFVGGHLQGREEERQGDGVLFKGHEQGTIRTFVYLNARSVPMMKIWFEREHQHDDTPGAWTIGYSFSPHVEWLVDRGNGHFDSRSVISMMPEALRDKLMVFWLGLEPFLKEDTLTLAAASHGLTPPMKVIEEMEKLFQSSFYNGLDSESMYNQTYFHFVYEDLRRESLSEKEEEDLDDSEDYLTRTQDAVFDRGSRLVHSLAGKLDLDIDEDDRKYTDRMEWLTFQIGIPGTLLALPELQPKLRLIIRKPSELWMLANRIKSEDPYVSSTWFKTPLFLWKLYPPEGSRALGSTPYREGPLALLREHMLLDGHAKRWEQELIEDVEAIKAEVPYTWVVDPGTLLPV